MSEELSLVSFGIAVDSNTTAVNTEKEEISRISTNLPSFEALEGLIDWVSFSLSKEEFSVEDCVKLLMNIIYFKDPQWVENRFSHPYYRNSLSNGNISVFFDPYDDKNGHLISFSGQGCREAEMQFIEGFDWSTLFRTVISLSGRFTRVDLALDDKFGYFDIARLEEKLRLGHVTTRFRTFEPREKFKLGKNDNGGFSESMGKTLNLGTRKSRIFIRFYDKAKQLGLDDVVWNRTEIEFKDERALELVKILLNRSERLGIIIKGVLNHYLTFREPTYSLKTGKLHQNKSRWEISDFWINFLYGVEKIKLTTQLPDVSIQRSYDWIKRQVPRSLARLYFAFQNEYDPKDISWLRDLIVEGSDKLNEKDREMIWKFRNRRKEYQSDESQKKISSHNRS